MPSSVYPEVLALPVSRGALAGIDETSALLDAYGMISVATLTLLRTAQQCMNAVGPQRSRP